MFDMIMRDILGNPATLIGLFALIGLTIQKKDTSEIMSGVLKTIIGFLILGIGAGVIVGALGIFGQMFDKAFGIQGVIPSSESTVTLLQNILGRESALIMILGMIINIFIAKYSDYKYIFLTGHQTLFMACLISAVLTIIGLSGLSLILLGGMVLGSLMVLSPAMLQKYTVQVTGSDEFAMGHFGSFGYFIAGKMGELFGDKNESTENMNIPKKLSFLSDTSVSLTITMIILYVFVALIAGNEFIESTLSNGTNYIIYSLYKGIEFTAGVLIVLYGIKMLIDEIVPAFKGIADKLAPNTKPALDCPTVFPYAPKAIIVGFLFSFLAGVFSIFILPLLGLTLIVPGLLPHFFCGGVAGIYGNATGGKKGAMLGGFVHGLIVSFLPALLLPFISKLGLVGATFSDSDFGIVGVIIGCLGKINIMFVYTAALLFFLLPFILSMKSSKKRVLSTTK